MFIGAQILKIFRQVYDSTPRMTHFEEVMQGADIMVFRYLPNYKDMNCSLNTVSELFILSLLLKNSQLVAEQMRAGLALVMVPVMEYCSSAPSQVSHYNIRCLSFKLILYCSNSFNASSISFSNSNFLEFGFPICSHILSSSTSSLVSLPAISVNLDIASLVSICSCSIVDGLSMKTSFSIQIHQIFIKIFVHT